MAAEKLRKLLLHKLKYGYAALLLVLPACDQAWNSPNPEIAEGNVLRTSFSERPKFLDPARSYSSNEYRIIAQVYEPPLQYHYLKRPYRLVPLTAKAMPKLSYIDAAGRVVDDVERATHTVYEIEIAPGIRYQPHPAFARGGDGGLLYFPVAPDVADEVRTLADFPVHASRELTAADYVYQIKRLADAALHSPVAGLFSEQILGFADFRKKLGEYRSRHHRGGWLDLRKFDMRGVETVGRYRYRITVDSGYPQFIYWLSMLFFSPMPWEADAFYSQELLQQRNVTLNWYPVGSGAYMLTENDPNLRMVLERNPHYHDAYYPPDGEPQDRSQGLLRDAGQKLPFLDKVVFSLEKEDIPSWNKFLQGYYDSSGISSDSFDQALEVRVDGEFALSEQMLQRGINLKTAVMATVIYIGFNMFDPVIGGYGERAVKLRRAISIAVDFEEFISIFLNGRGVAAQGPLPPGIFGHSKEQDDVNRYVYDRDQERNPVRKSLDEARALLREAGYEDGIDQRTGKPLVLYFDTVGSGPDAKSFLNWMRKQFAKLNVQLVIRNTDYNRFQDKMLNGNAQIFRWGWNADYPDPENFFFLLYGPHAKAEDGGENAANYQSAEFDRLYEKMKSMDNGPERREIIAQMMEILRRDAPWIWGFHPKSFSLHHEWLENVKPNLMANNLLKYYRLDHELRELNTAQWNRPVLWPLVLFGLLLLFFLLPAAGVYRRRLRRTAL